MRGGDIDRHVTLQPPTVTQDATGDTTTDWTQGNVPVFASRRDARGQELITAEGKTAERFTVFKIRFRAGVDVTWRLLDEDGTAYDIRSIARLGRKDALELTCRIVAPQLT